MKLYDHRLIQRGAVQSYEGHVNSHTRIQLGVDPSERFVFSGGYHFIAWKLAQQIRQVYVHVLVIFVLFKLRWGGPKISDLEHQVW